jgi:hypothetical protein
MAQFFFRSGDIGWQWWWRWHLFGDSFFFGSAYGGLRDGVGWNWYVKEDLEDQEDLFLRICFF